MKEAGVAYVPGLVIGAFRVRRGTQQLLKLTFACEVAGDEVQLSHEQGRFEWVDPAEYRQLAAAVVPSIDRPDYRAIGEDLVKQLDAFLATRDDPSVAPSP